jgi:hypothetical protein
MVAGGENIHFLPPCSGNNRRIPGSIIKVRMFNKERLLLQPRKKKCSVRITEKPFANQEFPAFLRIADHPIVMGLLFGKISYLVITGVKVNVPL